MLSLLAQATDAAPQSPFGGANSMLFLVLIFFAIFYFMIIRPQQKQQKQHKTFVAALKKGDEVVTTGGIVGKIVAVSDQLYTIEIANNVKVRVMKGQISGAFTAKEAAPAPVEEPAKK